MLLSRLQNLQVKMRGHGFPWSKLLMVMLVFAAGFIAHDVRSHGSFAGLTRLASLRIYRCVHGLQMLLWGSSEMHFGCLRGLIICVVFQIQQQPDICATQGLQLFLSRLGAK